MKFLGKAAAMVSAAAMAVSMSAAPALANTTQAYDIPTSESSIYNADGARYATAAGQHGSAVVGEYAGLSQVVNEIYATPGNGVSTSNYMYNPYFGIFGSDANEVPDPYTANLFYNWYVEANNMTAGATQLKKSDNAMVNMLFTASKGSSIVNDNSTTASGTSLTLEKRPDVLTVNPTGYGSFDDQIKAINNQSKDSQYYKAASKTYIGDDKYAPIYVNYREDNMGTQVANMWETAKAAQKVETDAKANSLDIVTRYGDSMQTAQNYELYTKGSILYTMSKIADGTVQKKTVAYVKGISGTGKDATVTLYSEPDPSTSREMAHHIECTVPTANNLANVLHPELKRETKMQSVTCTVEELAQADVILLADPDNMAYNFVGTDDSGIMTKPKWTKSVADADVSADNNWGQSATRGDGDGHFKNEFYGTQPATTTMVSNIKSALNDLGTTKATALAKKNIMSCVQEGSSSSDGGSIEAMSQYGIINAFVYPEIMSGVNQYGWWLDNIAHIKTAEVPGMVQILCQDMSLADGASLSDVNGYNEARSNQITQQYYEGLRYYQAHKNVIDEEDPWLTPTDDLTMPSTKTATQKITTKVSSKNYKAKDLKKKAKSFKIGAKAQGKLTYKAANSKSKKALTVSKAGKVTVKKGTKKGTYKVTVNAAATSVSDGAVQTNYKAAKTTVTVKVK